MSSSVADRDTYVLMKRFDMPDGNGTKDAWAVTSSHGLILVSFYTIMIKAIITQFWAGIVVFGVGLYLQRHPELDSSATTTTVGLWKKRHSAQRVAYFMTQRAFAIRSYRDLWYPLIWLAVAGVALAASLAVPIVKTQDLRIGNVAPVNPESIFVPPLVNALTDAEQAQAYSLVVPAALRAVGLLQRVSTPAGNETAVQFSYQYGISGSDFGLQKTPDLWLNVSGGCITDYTWYLGVDSSNGANVYAPWNDVSLEQDIPASGDDGPSYIYVYNPANPWNGHNYTYGIVPASFGRQSFSLSTDPWYLTVSNPNANSQAGRGFPYVVDNGRPALSCWEEDTWSFRGNASWILDLQNITGGRLSNPIYTILGEYLTSPMIVTIPTLLGRSTLESSTTVVSAGFNANQSSLIADMNRLVNTSYIATRNILSDSTTISKQGRIGLINALDNTDGSIPPRADEFVISSSDIYTLSMRVLIIVPTVFVGVLIMLLVLAYLPDPWRSAKERVRELTRKHTKSGKKKFKEDKETENGKQGEHVVIKGDDVDVDGDSGSKGMDDNITSID